MEEPTPSPKFTFFSKITFILLGIGSLSVWNSVITTLGYFQISFPSYDINYLNIYPAIIASLLFGLLSVPLANIISPSKRIFISLILVSVTLVLFPLLTKAGGKTGFWLFMVNTFFSNGFSYIMNSSSVSVASFNKNAIRMFNFGSGCSGISANVLLSICLALFNVNNQNKNKLEIEVIIFFSISAFLLILTGVFFYKWKNIYLKRNCDLGLLQNEDKTIDNENKSNYKIEKYSFVF